MRPLCLLRGRHVLFLAVFVSPLVTGGCSAPDPGGLNSGLPRQDREVDRDDGREQDAGDGRDAATGNGTAIDAGMPTDSGRREGGGGGTGDGGGGGGGGGGNDGGGTPQGIFAGAFTGTKPARSAKTEHAGNAAAPQNVGRENDCLTCHTGTTAPKFIFGGTVFSDAVGATPAVGVEIGLQLSNGTRVKATSDDDGNFWLVDDGVAAAGKAAARNATATRAMASALASGACNTSGCHGPGATAIHVP